MPDDQSGLTKSISQDDTNTYAPVAMAASEPAKLSESRTINAPPEHADTRKKIIPEENSPSVAPVTQDTISTPNGGTLSGVSLETGSNDDEDEDDEDCSLSDEVDDLL